MINLRRLKQSDAPLMLEWMHDEDVVHFMKADFQHKTLSDCEEFIKSAQDDSTNIHLAVADDNDTYMGTVSLKNIDDTSAEFAITMRKTAMGKGYAAEAMKQIIKKGFNELGLERIYWYVNPENKRAVRFYDKNGYQRISLNELCDQLNKSGTDFRIEWGTGQKRQKSISGILYKETKQQKSRECKFSETIEYGLSFCSGPEIYGGER
jgi:diamine N-acetyltransferase